MNRENERRASDGKPGESHYGLALHVGDVMYGNIGGEARLDFHGNRACGQSHLAHRVDVQKHSDRSPLLSAEFARLSGVEAECLGEFELKGGSRRSYAGKWVTE